MRFKLNILKSGKKFLETRHQAPDTHFELLQKLKCSLIWRNDGQFASEVRTPEERGRTILAHSDEQYCG